MNGRVSDANFIVHAGVDSAHGLVSMCRLPGRGPLHLHCWTEGGVTCKLCQRMLHMYEANEPTKQFNQKRSATIK